MYSPEAISRLAQIRAKCADGSVTKEELAEGVRLMRQDRHSAVTSAASASSGGRKRAAKKPVDVDNLFADLDKIG